MAGFLRYKIDNLSEGIQTIVLTINGNDIIKKVRVKKMCDGDLYLKYLNKNGQYRFYIFNRYYEKKMLQKLLVK